MRIVRLANFVTATSGGLRTALRCLGEGYLAAGHEPVLVVPGDRYRDETTSQGRIVTTPGWPVPGSGGYRVLLGRCRLAALLDELRPDRLEVSDRFTLRWTGAWARRRGVPAVMVSHESLAGLLRIWGVPSRPSRRLADALNARTAAAYDGIVCTTLWAGTEFARIGARNVSQVPLGVDLELFHPDRYDPELRARYATADELLIVHCSRLSVEKRPARAIDALAALQGNGVPAVLVVAGDGPLRERLRERAAGLPVRFLGFVDRPTEVAALLATADVVLAPGPVETFGLAALEALACGTPVVVSAESALPEVVGDVGVAVAGEGDAFAAGILSLVDRSATRCRTEARCRAEARRRAEEFGWPAAVAGFLTAHGLVDRQEVR